MPTRAIAPIILSIAAAMPLPCLAKAKTIETIDARKLWPCRGTLHWLPRLILGRNSHGLQHLEIVRTGLHRETYHSANHWRTVSHLWHTLGVALHAPQAWRELLLHTGLAHDLGEVTGRLADPLGLGYDRLPPIHPVFYAPQALARFDVHEESDGKVLSITDRKTEKVVQIRIKEVEPSLTHWQIRSLARAYSSAPHVAETVELLDAEWKNGRNSCLSLVRYLHDPKTRSLLDGRRAMTEDDRAIAWTAAAAILWRTEFMTTDEGRLECAVSGYKTALEKLPPKVQRNVLAIAPLAAMLDIMAAPLTERRNPAYLLRYWHGLLAELSGSGPSGVSRNQVDRFLRGNFSFYDTVVDSPTFFTRDLEIAKNLGYAGMRPIRLNELVHALPGWFGQTYEGTRAFLKRVAGGYLDESPRGQKFRDDVLDYILASPGTDTSTIPECLQTILQGVRPHYPTGEFLPDVKPMLSRAAPPP